MRRRPKARVNRLVEQARSGVEIHKTEDDPDPEFVPGAVIRARCLRAFRHYEARYIADRLAPDEQESDDARAGAILDAEWQGDCRRTADMMEAFLKAQG